MYLLDTDVVSELRRVWRQDVEGRRARDVDRRSLAYVQHPADGCGGVSRVGKLMAGKSDTLIEDAMIAATASVHLLMVVTRNTRDFTAFDVPMLDPFDAAG